MEKILIPELLKQGLFLTLFICLGWYYLKRQDRQIDIQNTTLNDVVKEQGKTIKESNELNKTLAKSNEDSIKVSKEISETNKILANKLTIKIDHIDDKLDDLKNEIRSNKK